MLLLNPLVGVFVDLGEKKCLQKLAVPRQTDGDLCTSEETVFSL